MAILSSMLSLLLVPVAGEHKQHGSAAEECAESARRRFPPCTRLSLAVCLLGVMIGMLSMSAAAHPSHVDHTDEQLRQMNTESLLHIEGDLRRQNELVDKHVASLHGRIAKAEKEREAEEKKVRSLRTGLDYEKRQSAAKKKMLEDAKTELQDKRAQMEKLKMHADFVRREIVAMEGKLHSLHRNKEEVEQRFENPTIMDVIVTKADAMGTTSHNVLNKTMSTLLMPGFLRGRKEALHLRHHIRSSSRYAALMTTLAIYAFLVYMAALVYNSYWRIRGRMTLSRALYIADLCFASYWAFISLAYLLLMNDPLVVMRTYHESVFVALQLGTAVVTAWYIFLRLFVIAATLKGVDLLELVCALFAIHHYYQRVWAPSLSDEPFNPGSTAYILYCMVYLAIAARRARSQILSQGKAHDIEEESEIVPWLAKQGRKLWAFLEGLLITMMPKSRTQHRASHRRESRKATRDHKSSGKSRVLYPGSD